MDERETRAENLTSFIFRHIRSCARAKEDFLTPRHLAAKRTLRRLAEGIPGSGRSTKEPNLPTFLRRSISQGGVHTKAWTRARPRARRRGGSHNINQKCRS